MTALSHGWTRRKLLSAQESRITAAGFQTGNACKSALGLIAPAAELLLVERGDLDHGALSIAAGATAEWRRKITTVA